MANRQRSPWLVSSTFFLWCYWNFCEAISGGFYADDRLQQSVLYKPLARVEKQELHDEILHILGLEHIPKPKHHDTHSSAPQYLLDLYKVLEDDAFKVDTKTSVTSNRSSAISNSDVIVSFINRIHHKSPHLRHQRDRIFWFDVSEIPLEQELVTAELRIYRNTDCKSDNDRKIYTLSIHEMPEEIVSDLHSLDAVDQISIACQDGWMVFNVTGPVMHWIAFPARNHGLYLKIKNTSHYFDPHELGIVGHNGPREKQPFMVAYFKTSLDIHVRKPRAVKKRQSTTYAESRWNPYSTYSKDMGHTRRRSADMSGDEHMDARRTCQRWNLYVSFKDLGWEDWIIAPDGYGAFYCYGVCSFPLNAHMNATNHAIVQTLVHLIQPGAVPKPCCAPTQLSAISVLYFDDNSNVVLKKYRNMVVKSCGCH